MKEFDKNVLFKNQGDSTRKSDIIGFTFEDEVQSQDCLLPLYYESINVLNSYGLLEDYYYETGSTDSPNIILAGFLIYASEKSLEEELIVAFSEIFIQNTYARAIWVDCLLEASGIAGLADMFNMGIKTFIKSYGVKGAAKILGKAAGRTIGWVGAGIAVFDFLDCMNDNY